MKPERFKKTKSVLATSALALVVAAATFGIASLIVGPRVVFAEHQGFDLTSGSGFSITSTIYDSPACSGASAMLYPGVTRCVVFTVQDNLKANISVTSISTTLNTTYSVPADCSGTNLELPTYSSATGFTVDSGMSATSPGVPIELKDNGANQKDCQGLTYHFLYSGTATYMEVYGTGTGVTSSQNPSTAGQSVTYTATVTASATSSQDPVPSSPTGTVTFTDNGSTICTAVPVTSTGTTTATAPCTINYATTSGSPHSIKATYVDGPDGNFNGSSGTLTQTVNPKIATTTALTSNPHPSTSGQSVTFTATVTKASGTGTPTGTVSFFSGTPTGTHTLLVTKTLASGAATYSTSSAPPLSLGTDPFYAVYSGDTNFATSTSPVYDQRVTSAACINSTTNGGYTVASGKFVCITGRVNGGITVKSGGSLFLDGASVNGGIVSTGALSFTSCASSINGNVTISGSTGPVLIGDGGDNQPAGDDPLPACAGNSINAVTISITNNTGSVEFGGNTVIGLVSITNNAGPEVEKNNITGTLTCSGDAPVPTNDNLKNTVVGVKLLQCAGSSF